LCEAKQQGKLSGFSSAQGNMKILECIFCSKGKASREKSISLTERLFAK
jgi:hypothetical protein